MVTNPEVPSHSDAEIESMWEQVREDNRIKSNRWVDMQVLLPFSIMIITFAAIYIVSVIQALNSPFVRLFGNGDCLLFATGMYISAELEICNLTETYKRRLSMTVKMHRFKNSLICFPLLTLLLYIIAKSVYVIKYTEAASSYEQWFIGFSIISIVVCLLSCFYLGIGVIIFYDKVTTRLSLGTS